MCDLSAYFIPEKCNHLLIYSYFHRGSILFLLLFVHFSLCASFKASEKGFFYNLCYDSFDTQRWQVVKCPKAIFCLLKVLLFINSHEFQYRSINAFHNEFFFAWLRILHSASLKSTNTNCALLSEPFIASTSC